MARPDSVALTEHLKGHGLHGVGAQIIEPFEQTHRVLVYGFVGTMRDSLAAEQQTHDYLADSTTQIVNRIRIDPQLREKSNLAEFKNPLYKNRGAVPPPPVRVGDLEEYKAQGHFGEPRYLYSRSPVTIRSILMGLVLGGPMPYQSLNVFQLPPPPLPYYNPSPNYLMTPLGYPMPLSMESQKTRSPPSGFRSGWFGGYFGR